MRQQGAWTQSQQAAKEEAASPSPGAEPCSVGRGRRERKGQAGHHECPKELSAKGIRCPGVGSGRRRKKSLRVCGFQTSVWENLNSLREAVKRKHLSGAGLAGHSPLRALEPPV